MALAAYESFERGFVHGTNGALSLTSNQTVKTFINGFARDADGRLVVLRG